MDHKEGCTISGSWTAYVGWFSKLLKHTLRHLATNKENFSSNLSWLAKLFQNEGPLKAIAFLPTWLRTSGIMASLIFARWDTLMLSISFLLKKFTRPVLVLKTFLWHILPRWNLRLSSRWCKFRVLCISSTFEYLSAKRMVLHATFWTNCSWFTVSFLTVVYTTSQ